MTMRYSHLASDHLRAAVAALDGVLSSTESEPTKVSAQRSAQERVAVDAVSAVSTSHFHTARTLGIANSSNIKR
jgi:hypothetical protein